MKRKAFFLLVIIFFAHLIFRVFSYSGEYLTHFDPKYWEKRYELSQWSSSEGCRDLDAHINPDTCLWDDTWYALHKNDDVSVLKKNSLGDDGLYTYAGWKYFQGKDPTLLNAEMPPLGKYLIGLSILVFKNQNIFALLSGIFVLISFFILNKIIFKNNLLAFLPVFIFSFDPIFYTQLRAPFLDLLYLGFLILTFIFFLKEKFLISMIFFGCMIATKASMPTFILGTSVMLLHIYYMKHNNLLKKFLLYLPVSILVFISSYSVYFILGHNIIDFIHVQKWIINFYTDGAKGNPTAVLQLILTGHWSNWWKESMRVSEWTILWPISFFTTLYYIFKVVSKHRLYPSSLLAFWVIFYTVFLAFIPVWPRYLLSFLPFMYTLSVWILSKRIHWLS